MTPPALFVSHGAPTIAIEDDAYTRTLREYGHALAGARAIAIVSAHWESAPPVRVNAVARPEPIYDFGGFPRQLYTMGYDAPGDARRARGSRAPTGRWAAPPRRGGPPRARAGDAVAHGRDARDDARMGPRPLGPAARDAPRQPHPRRRDLPPQRHAAARAPRPRPQARAAARARRRRRRQRRHRPQPPHSELPPQRDPAPRLGRRVRQVGVGEDRVARLRNPRRVPHQSAAREPRRADAGALRSRLHPLGRRARGRRARERLRRLPLRDAVDADVRI